MADDAPLSAEVALHKAAIEFAREIYAHYGIRIDAMRFRWNDIGTLVSGEERLRLTEVSIETYFKPSNAS